MGEAQKGPLFQERGESGNPENRTSGKPENRTLEEVKEEDSLTLRKPSFTSSSDLNLESAFPDSARILAATRSLFGEPVLGPPARYPDPRLLLAQIAEAYANRQRLKHPARVAYAKLEKGLPPDPGYLEDPAASLPPEFLQQLGLGKSAAETGAELEADPEAAEDEPAEAEASEAEGSEAEGSETELEPHPSLRLPVRERGPAAEGVWQTATGQLEVEMPRAVFHAWMRPARLAEYDPASNTFTVSAPNAYARDWLACRLSGSITRLLTGICNRSAAVVFTSRGGGG
jgi:hypothetical protein